jgi:hypothetical protein
MAGAVERVLGAVRRFTLGSGPLKRGTDRIEMASRMFVVAAVLAAAPVAISVGSMTRTHLHEAAVAHGAELHRTEALVLSDVYRPRPSSGDGLSSAYAARAVVRTRASWVTPAGSTRVGDVVVPAGTRAGTSITIWLTPDGRLTAAPADASVVAAGAAAAGALAFLAVPLAAVGLHLVTSWLLDRRRARQWAAGWASVAPVWNAEER